EVARRVRKHRLQRPEELDRKPTERGRPSLGAGARHGTEVAVHHGRAAHLARRHAERARYRIGHQAFERPLAELAERHADEKISLVLGGAAEEPTKPLEPPPRGAWATEGGDLFERAIDVGEPEVARRSGRLRRHPPKRGGADSDPPLARRTAQQR